MDSLDLGHDDLPSWAHDPISQTIEQLTHTGMLASTVHFCLHNLERDRRSYIDWALSLPGVENDSERDSLRTQINSFIDSELETEFSSTFAHCVSTIWASLELLFRTLATQYLVHERGGWEQKEVGKKKIVLSAYHVLDDEGRALYAVDKIDEPRWAVVSRFKHLFETLGLPHPSLDDSTKDILHELEQVRHLLAHRRGHADQKFLSACPGFDEGLAVGEPLRVTGRIYTRYNLAVFAYVHALIQSLRGHFNGPATR